MSTIEELSKVTGVSRADMDSIWKEVKANQSTLKACPSHSFLICLDRRTKQPIENPTPQQLFGAKWKCANCSGTVDALFKSAYEAGQKSTQPQPPSPAENK